MSFDARCLSLDVNEIVTPKPPLFLGGFGGSEKAGLRTKANRAVNERESADALVGPGGRFSCKMRGVLGSYMK